MKRKWTPFKDQIAAGVKHPKALNLYRFIRLILGEDISDYRIAARWHMDGKNFHEFKIGTYPVPRIERLKDLARILEVNHHLVFEVALGASAHKVYKLVKGQDREGQLELLSF